MANINSKLINLAIFSPQWYARRFHRGHWSFLGPGLEKTWCKTCSDKPNREWDRTAAMMIPHMVTESGHPVFGASSAFETRK